MLFCRRRVDPDGVHFRNLDRAKNCGASITAGRRHRVTAQCYELRYIVLRSLASDPFSVVSDCRGEAGGWRLCAALEQPQTLDDLCSHMLRTLFGTLAMWLVMLSGASQSLTGVTPDARPGVRTVEAPGAQPASFAITHVSLIDGTGSPPRSDMTVIVRAGRIEFVGPSREEPLGPEIPAVDGRGKFLLPGLIDTHAHVTYLNWREEAAAPVTGTYDDEVSRASLRLLLAFGITTVRNPGGPTAPAVALRARVGSGEVTGPFILTAGEILNRAPRFDGLTRPVATDADVQREVAAQAAAKVDFVKIYGNLPPDLVSSAIRAAHDRGLKVIGHLQATSWTEAARLGIDAITHGASWSLDELPSDRRERYRKAIAEQGAMRARLQWLDDVRPDETRRSKP